MTIERTIGKHIVPRYLYHVTTKQNYANMLKEQVIKPKPDKHFGEGFFMFELQNFMKNWSFDFGKYKSFDIRNILFENIIRKQNKHEMVLLRIDTNKLNKENLLIRSTKKLFQKFYSTRHFERRFQKHKFKDPQMKHLAMGDSALKFPLYHQRKDAVEFATREKLDINCAEYIGEFRFNKGDNIYDILKQVFENRGEKRAVEIYSPHK